jgi:two-component system, sensor histidine kinase LadS
VTAQRSRDLSHLPGAGILALLILLLSGSALADRTPALVLPTQGQVDDVKYQALVRADDDGVLDPRNLLQSDAGFAPFDQELDRSAGRTWLKIPVEAPPESDGHYVLKISQRFFVRLDVWLPDADGEHQLIRSGAEDPDRALSVGRQFIFPFQIPPGEQRDLLVRVETVQGSLQPLQLWIEDGAGFARNHAMHYLAYGLFFGILLALIFHNFALYLSLRQRGHLWYVLAMSAVVVMMLLDSGLAATHLLPAEQGALAFRLTVISVPLAYLLIGRFFQVFVHSRQVIPVIHWLVNFSLLALVLLISTLAVLPFDLVLPALLVIQPLLSGLLLLILVGSLVAGLRGSTEGWIFLLAWVFVLVGSVIRVLLTLDFLERSFFLEHSLYIATVLEASILALGLSYRVRQLRQRHSQALREQHRAARLSNLDPLTEAYNRRFLYNFLDNILHDEKAGYLQRAVLILDLDRFKQANDRFGHAAGDAILCELVARCQRVLRETDVLCRLGGDEFVIVLDGGGRKQSIDVARRIIASVGSQPFVFEGNRIEITASVGVVNEIPRNASIDDILRMADQALYQAKAEGKNRLVQFDSRRSATSSRRSSLSADSEPAGH